VHVTQDLLIGADHKKADEIRLFFVELMNGKVFSRFLTIYILVDTTIGITG